MNKTKNSIAALVLTGVALTGIGAITTSNSVNNNETISAMKGDVRYPNLVTDSFTWDAKKNEADQTYTMTYTFTVGKNAHHYGAKYDTVYDYLAIETIIGDAQHGEHGHVTPVKGSSEVKAIVANRTGATGEQYDLIGTQDTTYYAISVLDSEGVSGTEVTLTDTISYAGLENPDYITVNGHASLTGDVSYANGAPEIVANQAGEEAWTHPREIGIPEWHYGDASTSIASNTPDGNFYSFKYKFDVEGPVISTANAAHDTVLWSELFDKLAINTTDKLEFGQYHTGIAEGANVATTNIDLSTWDDAVDGSAKTVEIVNSLYVDPSTADADGNIQLHTLVDWSLLDSWTHPTDDINVPEWHFKDSTWYEEGLPFSDFTININENTVENNTPSARKSSYLSDLFSNFEFTVSDSEGEAVTMDDNTDTWNPSTDNGGGDVTDEGLSAGAIAGIVIGSLILVSILIGVIVYFALKSKEA